MKTKVSTIILTLGALVAMPSAFAGSESHGGGAWVCRNADDSIRWVKLVDLFEAKNRYGLQLDSFATLPITQQLAAVDAKVKSINPDVVKIYEETLAAVQSNIIPSSEAAIVRIPDAHFDVEPDKSLCLNGSIDYEQLANYRDDGSIGLASLLFNKMSLAEQSALYVHETIYKMYRDFLNATTSDEARKAVGYVFSNKPVTSYPDPFFGYRVSNLVSDFLDASQQVSDWEPDHIVQLREPTGVATGCEFLALCGIYSVTSEGCLGEVGNYKMKVNAHPDQSTIEVVVTWTGQNSGKQYGWRSSSFACSPPANLFLGGDVNCFPQSGCTVQGVPGYSFTSDYSPPATLNGGIDPKTGKAVISAMGITWRGSPTGIQMIDQPSNGN